MVACELGCEGEGSLVDRKIIECGAFIHEFSYMTRYKEVGKLASFILNYIIIIG